MDFIYENNLKEFSKKLNIYVSKILDSDNSNNTSNLNTNWRIKKDNNIIKLKKKNNIIMLINKLVYLDKNNFDNIELYNIAKERQKKLLKIIKEYLNDNKDNTYQNLYDLFFESKQDLLIEYFNNNEKKSTLANNVSYKYLLENIVFEKQYHDHLKNIFNEIINKFIRYDYVLLNNEYQLTPFPKLFLTDTMFNSIVLEEKNNDECTELILDIKNKLKRKVLIILILVNLLIKHDIIDLDKYYNLLNFIKNKSLEILDNSLKNIIYDENIYLWHYYYIINYILFYNNAKYFKKSKKKFNKFFEDNKFLLEKILNNNSYFNFLINKF